MSRRYLTHPVDEDGWTEWIAPEPDYRIRCCDCSLVHDVEHRVVKGSVQLRFRRNERATAASRRNLSEEGK